MNMPRAFVELATQLEGLGLRLIANERHRELRGGYKDAHSGGLTNWFQISFHDDEWQLAVEPSRGQVAPVYRFATTQEMAATVLTHYRDRRPWPPSGFEF